MTPNPEKSSLGQEPRFVECSSCFGSHLAGRPRVRKRLDKPFLECSIALSAAIHAFDSISGKSGVSLFTADDAIMDLTGRLSDALTKPTVRTALEELQKGDRKT
jgi:hypothetical protein